MLHWGWFVLLLLTLGLGLDTNCLINITASTVARGYAYAALLVTPFRICDDIDICSYHKVIFTSGFSLPSWIYAYANMIILQSAVDEVYGLNRSAVQ